MPCRLVCPHCREPVRVEERFLGTEVACPRCSRSFPAAASEARRFGCPACGQHFQVAWPPASTDVACPSCGLAVRVGTSSSNTAPTVSPPNIDVIDPSVRIEAAPAPPEIEIPTEDGGSVRVHEPVKIIRKGSRSVALRKLSPEEKSRRRAVRTLVCFALGVSMLSLTLLVLRWWLSPGNRD